MKRGKAHTKRIKKKATTKKQPENKITDPIVSKIKIIKQDKFHVEPMFIARNPKQ